MPTPEEELIPTENEAEGAALPRLNVTVEIPYAKTSERRFPRRAIVSSAAALEAELSNHLMVNPVVVEDSMHTTYSMAVGGDGSRVGYCPDRVIMPLTQKQEAFARQAHQLAREIAKNTRAKVIAQLSAPQWDALPSTGQGGRGLHERAHAAALGVKIALQEVELHNLANRAEEEGALVLPRNVATEISRRVDMAQARGEAVTDAVFAKIVSRVETQYAPFLRRDGLGNPEPSRGQSTKKTSRATFPLNASLSSAFQLIHLDSPGKYTASHKSIPIGRTLSFAATAIVVPMIMVDCGGGRAIVPTPGSEMIHRIDQGYETNRARNIAVGTTLSRAEQQANPAMQQLLDGLAAHNTSYGIPLTNKAEVITMKGPDGFVSQFAFTEDTKSDIKTDKGVVPVTIARIGPEGKVMTVSGVYFEETKADGTTMSWVTLVKKTATGWGVDDDHVLYHVAVDTKGNITIAVADTKRTSPYYVELIGTVPIDPNPPKKNQPPDLDPFEPAMRAMGFLSSIIISNSESTSQAPTGTPKVETPTPRPPTPKPTDVQPTQTKESTKVVEKIANVPPEEWGKMYGISVPELEYKRFDTQQALLKVKPWLNKAPDPSVGLVKLSRTTAEIDSQAWTCSMVNFGGWIDKEGRLVMVAGMPWKNGKGINFVLLNTFSGNALRLARYDSSVGWVGAYPTIQDRITGTELLPRLLANEGMRVLVSFQGETKDIEELVRATEENRSPKFPEIVFPPSIYHPQAAVKPAGTTSFTMSTLIVDELK